MGITPSKQSGWQDSNLRYFWTQTRRATGLPHTPLLVLIVEHHGVEPRSLPCKRSVLAIVTNAPFASSLAVSLGPYQT